MIELDIFCVQIPFEQPFFSNYMNTVLHGLFVCLFSLTIFLGCFNELMVYFFTEFHLRKQIQSKVKS